MRILLTIIIITGFIPAYTFAQMGHGMMREGHTMGQGHMTDQGHMTEQEGRPGKEGTTFPDPAVDRGTMGDMMIMIQDIAVMMRQMSTVMSSLPDMDSVRSRDRSYGMSILMKDMADEMNMISTIIGRGTATEEEMKAAHNRIMELQKAMREFRK
jgi:hypothetical protein